MCFSFLTPKVIGINGDADTLTESYPDAVEHILAKRRELLRAVEKLDTLVTQRDTQLEQNDQLLDYNTNYRELMSWAAEYLARMCNPELSKDLQEALTVHSRHEQLKEEFQGREAEFANFQKFGEKLLAEGHYMSDDIQEKMTVLCQRKTTLSDFWQLRNRLYEQHMDYLRWLKEINDIEGWLQEREPEVNSQDYGNTFDELDKLMIKQLEMEEALLNKDEKMGEIRRITLIESEFKTLKAKEEEARRADEERAESERLEAIKKKEMARKSRERRREDERRRTQEIVLPPNHAFNKE